MATRQIAHRTPLSTAKGELLLEQVARDLEQQIALGRLLPGDRLPSERTLAAQLGLSRNTVTAAYRLLEKREAIRRVPQRGAFVRPAGPIENPIDWSSRISRQAHLLDEPVLDMLAQSRLTNLRYRLSAGTPALGCFPMGPFRRALHDVLNKEGVQTLAIAPTEGQPRLRRAIAAWDGAESSHVLVVAGAQEGIDLLARCLVEPGDRVIVDRPTYPGAIQAFQAAGAQLVEWDTKEWSAKALERLLIASRPKLIFTMPTFHNPTARTMEEDQRTKLLNLAARYRVPVIENDVYSRTRLQGSIPPSLYRMDKHNIVIYLSTFSKVLAPGLRVGWIAAPPHMVKQLSLVKMRASLFTEGLLQLTLATLLENGIFEEHLPRLQRTHAALQKIAVDALRLNFAGDELEFSVPQGGLYIWCRWRRPIDMEAVLLEAQQKGASVAPGRAFFAGAPDENCFRICFTACSERDLPDAIRLLADAFHAAGDPSDR
ncbi:MAG TPA: PLP-dependent aminotransferase family protein [Acidobacteriaceae bacterium]|nr:PLP-dependent aminotransferase family protein [Acidobacteriaceae bacterium]